MQISFYHNICMFVVFSDIWSLGVILYMLVCGQAPFQEANDSETLTMIMDCKYTIPSYISEDCKRYELVCFFHIWGVFSRSNLMARIKNN